MPLDKNPWVYLFDTRKMNETSKVEAEASDDIREKLAKHLDVDAVDSVKAKFLLSQPKGSHAVKVEGTVKAKLKQTCVITLEPLRVNIKEDFEAYYADYSQATPFAKAKKNLYSKYGMDEIPIMEEDEEPEPMRDGKIDLGELAMQYLSLAINPYPHKEGLPEEEKVITVGKSDDETYKNPFEALRDLQNNTK